MAVRRGGFRGENNEVTVGDGWALAWRFSAGVRRWREAAEPIGGDASFEERGAASERKLARLAVARSAPPWVVALTVNRRSILMGSTPPHQYSTPNSTIKSDLMP